MSSPEIWEKTKNMRPGERKAQTLGCRRTEKNGRRKWRDRTAVVGALRVPAVAAAAYKVG